LANHTLQDLPTNEPSSHRFFFSSFFFPLLLQDVSNVGRNGNANGKGKIAKRSNGVKTRSMTVGVAAAGTNEVSLAPRPGVASDAFEYRNPAAAPRDYTQRPRIAADPNSYQMTGNTDNIDERDADDPLSATAYVQDMYDYFRGKEQHTSVRPVFMETQSHINERMRAILVDWLVEVHLKFKLVPETLYLTINLIDRYLEREEVSRPKLQLVGVTSLLIASKYEEIYPPELRDLVYICDRAYTRQDVSTLARDRVAVSLFTRPMNLPNSPCCISLFRLSLQIIEMEEEILKTLEYQITIPSAHAFLVRFLKAGHADKKIVQLSCYILDGTLQSYNLLHYLPSQLAAAAVFIARRVVGRNSWSPTLLMYSDYCEEEVIPVARAVLTEKASANPELRAVNKKYSSSRYGGVANTTLTCDF
jgi:cyclin B